MRSLTNENKPNGVVSYGHRLCPQSQKPLKNFLPVAVRRQSLIIQIRKRWQEIFDQKKKWQEMENQHRDIT